MEIVSTAISDVKIVYPDIHRDGRGYFAETYSEEHYRRFGIDASFVQDNESMSTYGVMRGLHYQRMPYTQSKLVRCVKGAVLDVAVDIRKGSPTYGQHVSVELSGENQRQFFIPKGFAHGFVVLTDEVIFQYKCDNFYAPQHEGAIAWDDPDLGIDWKVPADKIILSAKDTCHPRLKDAQWLFDYNEKLY